MKITLKNNIIIEKIGEVLIIDKRNTFFSDSKITVRIKDIVGLVQWQETIIVVINGFSKIDFNLNENIEKLKRLPNSIVGSKEELDEIYKELYILVQDIPII